MALSTSPKPYSLQAQRGLAELWWKSGRVAVKTSGEETGGRFSQIESTDPRHSAPPLHIHHNEDEAFFVLDGEVELTVDGEQMTLRAGDYALCPRGVPHAYLVRSEQARMLVTFSPAGFEGAFVDMGVAVEGTPEAPADSVFPSPAEMTSAFARYGCEIVGPPPGS